MSVLEYIRKRGRTEVIKHPVVLPPEIVYPDRLISEDIKLFIDTNGSGNSICVHNYIHESYIDPYHMLDDSYKKLGRTFYNSASYNDLDIGYIEYTVDLRQNPNYAYLGYAGCTSYDYYASKYLYAIVTDGLLLCVIDDYMIKTSTGNEYSFYEFDSIPSGLRGILIKVITNHNRKIIEERSRVLRDNNEYAVRVKNQKERIQNILNGN